MKELSIEEKAKLYDEALEKARQIHNANRVSGIELTTCEEIFPELAESEDERIRKELLNYLYDVHDDDEERAKWIALLEKQGKNNMGISEATKQKLEDNLNKALEKETPESWNEFLEKQGEHAKFRESIQVGDKVTRNQDGQLVNLSQLQRTAKPSGQKDICDTCEHPMLNCQNFPCDKKQGEQKPAENSCKKSDDITTEERERTEYKKGFECGKQRVLKYPEDFDLCKKTLTAWSEEDETMITDLSIVVHTYFSEISGIPFKYDLSEDKIRTWLKSLKERVLPKQEWDEKDKCMLNNVIDTLKPLSQTTYSGYAINSMINWLKSLRPQNTWKPSAFHLECIEDAISLYEKRGINAIGLKEILDELKKLRKE